MFSASKEDVVSANKFSPIADCINSRSFTDNSMVCFSCFDKSIKSFSHGIIL